MRSIYVGALIAAAAFGATVAGGAAVAQVSTQPLAPGEVLLEVVAVGTSSAPADRATLTATVTASGATEAEAERALEAALERVRAAARAAGVRAEDITTAEAMVTFDIDDYVRTDPTTDQPPAAPEVERRRALELELRDVARVEAVRQALRDAGATGVGEPSYALADASAARRAARTNALRAARAQADGYAADLGLRVVRIVRVTERVGMDIFNIAISDPSFARRFQPNRANTDPRIESVMFVGVDFALAPR